MLCSPLPSVFKSFRWQGTVYCKHWFTHLNRSLSYYIDKQHQCSKMLFLFICLVAKVMFDSFQLHGLEHTRLPCPSLSPGVCSNSCPMSWWCYLTISSSVAGFSFCLQSFPASGSFPVSQLFESGGQSIRASASATVLPMNIQGWFPLELTSLISL